MCYITINYHMLLPCAIILLASNFLIYTTLTSHTDIHSLPWHHTPIFTAFTIFFNRQLCYIDKTSKWKCSLMIIARSIKDFSQKKTSNIKYQNLFIQMTFTVHCTTVHYRVLIYCVATVKFTSMPIIKWKRLLFLQGFLTLYWKPHCIVLFRTKQ